MVVPKSVPRFRHSDSNTCRHLIGPEYCGVILNGNYTEHLKQRLAEHISHFRAFDAIGNPAMPYISAWSEFEQTIWYEFASSRLSAMFGCRPERLPGRFREAILDYCVYQPAGNDSDIRRQALNSDALQDARLQLRRECREKGGLEAIYKLALADGSNLWLKDQAKLEVHAQDGICLSLGILFDVSKEMEAENRLKQVEAELKRHRGHLEDLVKERTRELRSSQLEIVSRLARAVEYRDIKTGLHNLKMSHYCAILGQASGLRRRATALLFQASPMHDIGKIGISDRILLKPGRLSFQEFEQMKTHCTIGAELLAGHDSVLLQIARKIALTHHEKWDGSGYPRGLAKAAIPLAGRIAAICDVFDALTSERPYKKAWPVEKAIDELHQGKGRHFDPDLVNLFLEKLPAIKQVYHRQDLSPSFH